MNTPKHHQQRIAKENEAMPEPMRAVLNPTEEKPRERHPDKLIAKAKSMRVKSLGKNRYNVHSPSGNDYTVEVRPDEQMTCTCEYAAKQQDEPSDENPTPETKPVTCSHTIAVAIKRANKENKELSLTTNTDKKTSKHKVTSDGIAFLTRRKS